MAGIDKTYVDNYKDYKDVIDYARKTKFECPNGIIINLSDYLYSEISKEDFEKHLKECPDKEIFAKELKSSLMYYVWSKSEYEIIISPWCGGRNTKDKKVDIYSQVMLNWDKFVDYVWNFRKV